MPEWVNTGYGEFAGRLPPECRLHLIEIALGRRAKGADVARAVAEEGERMLAAIPKDSLVIALEVDGKSWSFVLLVCVFAVWLLVGCVVVMLVRIVAAEQLYRAWSGLQGHPYHRA